MALQLQKKEHLSPIEFVEAQWAHAHETWKAVVGPIAQVTGVTEIADLIDATPVNQRVPLNPVNLFRWATFPFDEIKVVMIGDFLQAEPGWATGLGLSTISRVPDDPTIYRLVALASSAVGDPRRPKSNDLAPWAQQGVCLLTVFGSCAAKRESAHMGGDDLPWLQFAKHVLNIIAQKRAPVVFLTMGSWSRQAVKDLERVHAKSKTHAFVHAGPLFSSGGEVNLDNHLRPLLPMFEAKENVFWRVNKYLREWMLEPINWAAEGLVGGPIQSSYFLRRDCAVFAHSGTATSSTDKDKDVFEGFETFDQFSGDEDDSGEDP